MFRNFVNRMPGTSVIAGSQDRRRRRASAHAQGLEILESRQLLSATVYTVDLTSDTGTSTSAAAGDLLYCLTRANADTNPDGTEIVFDPSVFNSTSPQTITLDSTLVLGNPAGPMSIQGPGAEIVTISGDNAVGVFQVSTGVSASIGDLTITDGSATDGAGIFNSGTLALTKTNIEDNVATALGGGIFSWGKLTLDGCQITGNSGGGVFASSDSRGLVHVSASDGTTISGNKAGGEAGGIAVSGGVLTLLDSSVTGNTGVLGAGILMDSSDDALNVTNSVISDNVVSGNGAGGIDGGGTMTITGSTISSNSGGFGGGIGTSGTLTISASTISDNTAGTAGGIVCSGTTLIEDKTIISGNQGGNQGGGIFNDGTLTIKDSTIGGPDLSDGNSANIGGGIADNYAGSVTVTDCTFEYNLAPNSSNGGAGEGAAIWSSTTLSVTGSTLSHNTAYYGGAIQVVGTATITNSQFTDNSARTGGAIASGDKLTVEGCTFDSNSAPSGSGGALYNSSGSATITGSTFSSNSAAGFGGGILVRAGQLTLEQTTVSGNTATYDGGGIFDEGKLIIEDDSFISKNTTNGNGGGIDTYGTVTISVAQSTVEDNSAGVDGGGIDDFQLNTSSVMTIDDSVISGNQGLGNTYGGGLTVSGTTTISDGSQITDNTGRYGGGIYNSGTLNISSSTVSGNTAPYGGGIDCFSTGTFTGVTMSGNTGSGINCFGNTTISDSTISKNTGGGIQNFGTLKVAGSTFASNSGSQGGALANFSGGSASITASTLTGNKVPYFGGGILVQSGTVTITNTTISGNTTSSAGGAVYNDNSGKFKAVNSTIVGNVSLGGTGTGGGIDAPANGDTTLENTIVVLNTDGTGAGATADDLAGGTLAAATAYDLVGTDKTGSLVNGNDGNLVGVSDPNLGSLAYNGGPTETIALQAGSPAIGAGSLALAVDAQGNPLVYDQRGVGYPRTANGQVDLGAFETAAATQSAPQVTVNPVNITYGTSLNDSQLSGTATVLISGVPENLPGTFSFGSLVGTVLGAGSGQTETVTFTPIDTTDYQSVQLPVTVNVAAALPLLSVNNVTLPEGTALDNSQLTGSAAWVVAAAAVDVPGTFSYTTVVGTVPPPGATIESVTFTPADSVDYSIETDRIIVTEQAGLEPVTVALATSANFVLPGQTVTFTVTVSPPNGDNNSPTGVVTLNVNGASGTLVNGVATITTSFAAGLTEVTASFGPNSQFLGGLSNTVYELAEPNLTPQASDYVSTAWSGAAFTPAEPVTWVDGTTHFIGLDAFGTIQAGIDGVAAGGVVHVAPGSYTEQLTINQNLTLVGSVQAGSSSSVIIQSPSGAGGNLITITNNANAQITNLALNDGTQSWTAIDAGGGSLTAAGLNVTGFRVGTAVENDSTATITASLFSGDGTGIVLGSGSSDNSSLTATGDSFINDNLGVDNIQSSGTANATLDWWGTATGPLNSNNPGGTGTPVSSQVDFSPWLGGSKTPNPQSLVFLTQAGGIYSVAPLAGNSSVSVTSNLGLAQTVPGGDTITFSGGGITVTIDGESGTSSLDNFIIMDNSVEYTSADGLDGTTVDFPSASVTRNVDAFGAANTFDIASTGAGGPFNLIGNSGANRFVLTNNFSLLGTITGDGSSTIDYSGYNTGVSVNLGNGTNGTGTGISGAIRGINAIVGTAFNDSLNAGSVANVFLTGGLGENQLTGIASGRTDVAETGVNFTLTNTSLTAPGIDDVLTRIKIAQLNDVLGGGTFSVSGWTGTGSLSAPLNNPDTVDATKGANFKLSDTSLSTADGMSMNLSGITTANLTDGSAGGVTFTVSGWTGGGSLVDGDTGGSFDAVTSTKGAGYTLSDTALTSTDGMSLSLSGLTSANLTDLSGANTFDVSGWDQAANLADSGSTADTVDATKNASFTLTNTSLIATDGLIASLSRFGTANLISAFSDATFTVSSWNGSGSLTSGDETGGGGSTGTAHAEGLIATKNANFTLSDTSLTSTDGMSMSLSGITLASLTATTPNKTFTVSGWTGRAILTGGGSTGTGSSNSKGPTGTVVAVKDASFTLSNSRLTSTDGMNVELFSITTADLTDTSSGGNTIALNGWTGNGSLAGNSDTLNAVESGNVTLSNTALKVGSTSIQLSGLTAANLTVTAAAGQSSYVVDASSFSAGPANVTVGGSANAIVFGGTAGNDALTIATGATGNNILIGNGPGDSLTDNGSGYAILIGAGTGGDTLTGNGNDILISGTTVYDRDTSANIAALDAILANWASNATYAQRIALVENPPLHSPGLNGSTITPDAGSNTLQEASGETADQDLYIASSLDAVYPQDGEGVTII
jgi:predicted outer membrane repeat protein